MFTGQSDFLLTCFVMFIAGSLSTYLVFTSVLPERVVQRISAFAKKIKKSLGI